MLEEWSEARNWRCFQNDGAQHLDGGFCLSTHQRENPEEGWDLIFVIPVGQVRKLKEKKMSLNTWWEFRLEEIERTLQPSAKHPLKGMRKKRRHRISGYQRKHLLRSAHPAVHRSSGFLSFYYFFLILFSVHWCFVSIRVYLRVLDPLEL